MTKQHKLLSLAACMSAALVASSAMAAETPAAQTSAKEVLPRTLEGYVSQDKAFWDYLKANHPYFKYLKEGRVVGKFTMSDREEEWVNFGGGDKYREDTGRTTAVTYRLPYESFLDLPNNFVGPKKCGECHPSQYEKWERSRHNKIVRFPEEMTEAVVQGDLKRPLYGSKASVLPEAINVEDVYVLMGTPRTKYGFVDKWLVRGTYHIEDGGNLSQGERQLLNIARAACANPPVLILDEATSSIDTRTEKLIEKGMDRLMAGRTVFVIAHRLSTVRNAKAIMVLEQGSIIERGDHDDLIAQHGRYYQLYTGQAELS